MRVYSSPKPTQPDSNTSGVENFSPQNSIASFCCLASACVIVFSTFPPRLHNREAIDNRYNLRVFHVVLYQPEIPPNTGNIIRLCANTGARLHLIHPLGFWLDNKLLRRAGLDYRELAHVVEHRSWQAFREATGSARVLAFSTRGTKRYDEERFRPGDALLFGPESRGLPPELLAELGPRQVLRIPMLTASRSLNLANAAAIAVYEAWRQLGFPGTTG